MVNFELNAEKKFAESVEKDDIMNLVLENCDGCANPSPEGLKEDYKGDWKDITISIPEGDSEKPDAEPYDKTAIKTAMSKEDNPQIYAQALSDLKKSFKESIEVLDLLEKSMS